jgi:PncC family amidohydrolase
LNTPAQQLTELLAAGGQTAAIAEATTGGLAAHLVAQVPGASSVLLAGIAPYANAAKIKLGVPEESLRTYGAVSRQVAESLAESVRAWAEADVGLAESGIAGPADPSGRQVGTFWMAVATRDHVTSHEYRFHGDRSENQASAAEALLSFAIGVLSDTTP